MTFIGLKREIVLENFGFSISEEAYCYKKIKKILNRDFEYINKRKFTFFCSYYIQSFKICRFFYKGNYLIICEEYKDSIYSSFEYVNKDMFDKYFESIFCELLHTNPKKVSYL